VQRQFLEGLLGNLLTSSLTETDQMSYVYSPPSPRPNFIASVMTLEALVSYDNTYTDLITKLVNFISLTNRSDIDFMGWYSSEQLSHFMIALSDYDQRLVKLDPSFKLKVLSSNNILLESDLHDSMQTPEKKNLLF